MEDIMEEETNQPERASTPYGIGLTLIIGGIVLVLYGIFSGLFSFISSSIQGSISQMTGTGAAGINPNEFLELSQPINRIQGIMHILMGLISITALVAGIQLIKYKDSGRRLSLIWATIALVYIVADFIVHYLIILPGSEKMAMAIAKQIQMNSNPEMQQPLSSDFLSGITKTVGSVVVIISNLVLAIAPILTLIFMTRQKAKDACS